MYDCDFWFNVFGNYTSWSAHYQTKLQMPKGKLYRKMKQFSLKFFDKMMKDLSFVKQNLQLSQFFQLSRNSIDLRFCIWIVVNINKLYRKNWKNPENSFRAIWNFHTKQHEGQDRFASLSPEEWFSVGYWIIVSFTNMK